MIVEMMKCDVPGCRRMVRCPDDGDMPPGWGKVFPDRGPVLHVCPVDVVANPTAKVDRPL